MRHWIRGFALMWVLSVTAAPATTAKTPLTLGQAVALVLENNPQLQAADFDTRAAAARIRQQSQATPWQLGLTLDKFAGSGEAGGTGGLETTLSLGRVLELGNKSQRRGELEQHRADLLRHEQDAQRLDLLAQTTTRFIAVAHAQAKRKLAAQQLAVTQNTLNAVERRVRVGAAAAAERSRAEISLARAELALEETAHLLANTRRQLAIMWGEFEPAFLTVQAELSVLQPELDYVALEQVLERNPALVRLATAERLAEARSKLIQASRRPDVDISAGLHRYNDTDDTGLMLSLRMPLGSRERAVPFEGEAQALIEREPLLAKDKRLALRATLFVLHQESLHDRDRFEMLQQRIIPAAETLVADYSKAYAAGRYSLLELDQAQNTLLQARMEALDAATDHHENRVQIDRLIGANLSAGEQQ